MVETLLASDWGFSLHRVKDFLRVAKNPIKIDPKMAPKSHGTHSRRGGTGRFRLDPNPAGFTPFLPWSGPSMHAVGGSPFMGLGYLEE